MANTLWQITVSLHFVGDGSDTTANVFDNVIHDYCVNSSVNVMFSTKQNSLNILIKNIFFNNLR